MTLTELIHQQQQEQHARKALALRNAEIQSMHRRRALYGDRNPTRPLSARELKRITRPSRLRVFTEKAGEYAKRSLPNIRGWIADRVQRLGNQ